MNSISYKRLELRPCKGKTAMIVAVAWDNRETVLAPKDETILDAGLSWVEARVAVREFGVKMGVPIVDLTTPMAVA